MVKCVVISEIPEHRQIDPFDPSEGFLFFLSSILEFWKEPPGVQLLKLFAAPLTKQLCRLQDVGCKMGPCLMPAKQNPLVFSIHQNPPVFAIKTTAV